ncbi:MAG: hypothetical protein KGY80_12405 [Candidatus Thorarchaeota archaeon]|nr:hypothetical protein [Candidatus Thorarchaeota archaeon]
MPERNTLDEELLRKILSMPEDLGPGSKELSSKIDDIIYGADSTSSSREDDMQRQSPKQAE